ncbi:acyloxyacyl hydrolase [Neorhizobium sp. P12A]|uniref:acyloxyacyl hydrolase n=1 Tax=Neorhizobium sp. P12A TaxID=2268027 RepID=UPI0011EE15A2|nr:acyloxyacyl hydrolase [Neorhizobium sp. P12A]KAA0690942.1 acyloxyacyl hydrolase [Neorhizobium sp. P12A]
MSLHVDLIQRFSRNALSAFVLLSSVAIAWQPASGADLQPASAPPAAPALPTAAKIFDELRFGLSGSIEDGHDREDGVMPDLMLLFNPFGYNPADDWKGQLLHPRIHIGTSIGTTSTAAQQLYGGLTWTLTNPNGFFTEAGFGGVVHNGNLTDENDGPKLGCHLLFHEYVGAGYNFDSHWSLMAQVAHSSHANLCDGPNGGMTRAGLMVGYKF